MKNITYLFGAGASAQAMPTVAELPTALEVMHNYFSNIIKLIPQIKSNQYASTMVSYYGNDELKKLPRIIETIEALGILVKSHASIDTLFKKIYLADLQYLSVPLKTNLGAKFHRDELLSVYNFLLLFIEYSIYKDDNFYLNYKKQIEGDDGGYVPNPAWTFLKSKIDIDLRYDAFLATILEKGEKGLKLPDNIKIVSWNYDIQLERALYDFIQSTKREEINSILRYCDKDVQNPSFFKLNGSSLIFDSSSELNKISARKIDSNYYVNELLLAYLKSINLDSNECKPCFSNNILFEWDNSSEFVRNTCIKAIENTEILVVVGYSIPTFNRKVDRELYCKMPLLEKIYLQTRPETLNDLKISLQSLLGKDYYYENDEIYVSSNKLKELIKKGKGYYKVDASNNSAVKYYITQVIGIDNISQFFIPPEFQ